MFYKYMQKVFDNQIKRRFFTLRATASDQKFGKIKPIKITKKFGIIFFLSTFALAKQFGV